MDALLGAQDGIATRCRPVALLTAAVRAFMTAAFRASTEATCARSIGRAKMLIDSGVGGGEGLGEPPLGAHAAEGKRLSKFRLSAATAFFTGATGSRTIAQAMFHILCRTSRAG